MIATRGVRTLEVSAASGLVLREEVPWCCTDLAVCDYGDLLASAVLEDTRDAYQDGPCLGSSLVRMAPDGEFVWLVSDADDRAVPSQLLRAALS